ncbi:c-di-AMP phosphodiesterase, consists of a GGDEF-like and DHH domains [Atopostipes suicloacalis DSM 15692]|uniref:Cyclic-di-AMP phosphodiesterase n=1 Tax=Atopostipes suicloacalis DSM 15692 TaxID=1121025 RepID=A0A1M4X7B5_9LACT|nr:DHH family phosphoesterase [Atopostipes suicloacalis]SHE89410.1 c-di-AMP phosphodiesterase, consists of a GGDEF-like and DHH domains [Atopostipes suicloacalis DSM 15692]
MKPLNDKRLASFFKIDSLNKVVSLVIAIQIFIVFISVVLKLWLGLLVLLLFIIMDVVLWRLSERASEDLNSYISNLSYRIKRGEHEAIIKLPIGIIIYNEDLEIEWLSPYLQTGSKDAEPIIGRKIQDVFDGILEAMEEDDPENKIINWRDNYYRIRVEKDIHVIYLENVSYYIHIREELERNRSVIGWLFLDNYDELIKGLDDRAISNFNSLLTTYLSNWARQHNIYYKRIENDKYLLLLRHDELARLEDEDFNIVNNIRDYTSKRNLPLTVSIGVSYGEASFIELAELSQKDLDLALGRGGDQAIVREVGQEPRYYGGNTNPMEKRTRVRSRMISEALQEQIKQAPTTYVMGHAFPDMDAIGSALGIARIAMMLGKEAKVIVDQEKVGNDISNLLDEISKYHETAKNIISPEEAFEKITSEDLVVMVDHHKPSMSIAPHLNEKTNKVVIIDHHRRGDEFPDKPTLVYIEPYASSASELITELFEYVSSDSNSINRIEATTMLGGIIVDTNNFSLRTGSRTFDAASYLQSVGANTTTIQRMLKESPENYLTRMEIVKNMEFVIDGMAVAHGEENEYHRQVVAAQTADTILSMTDVEASFVIVRLDEETVGISARSLGKVNVQRVMEKMGGGGHLTNAATQIKDLTITEVKEQLKQAIKEINT